MQFDLFTLKAKKSISQLLSKKNGVDNVLCGIDHDQIENGMTNFQTPDPSPEKTSVGLSANDLPSSNESLSRRKGLVGSLRENKLRSINSLRNLRSPPKAKQPDTTALPCTDQSPRTPTHRPKSSLVLNFQESPADEPIIDLSHTDSTSLDQDFYYSSPLPIPASENKNPKSYVVSSVIPAGTVPSSPAPLRKILDLEQPEDFPSQVFGPAFDLDLACVELLAPIQDIEDSKQTQDTPREATDTVQATTEHCHVPTQGLGSGQFNTGNVTELGNDCQFMHQESPIDDLTERFDQHCLDANGSKTSPENMLIIIGKDYLLRIFHNGDLRRRIGITAYDGNDHALASESDIVFARREKDFAAAEKMMPELSRFIALNKGVLANTNKELMLDEALAEGILPEWLDLDLEMESSERLRSRISNHGQIPKRESTWGQHVGLYDGTGYGTGSSSCSSMAVETGVNDFYHGVENINSEDEIEEILSGTYEKIHPLCPIPDPARELASAGTTQTNAE